MNLKRWLTILFDSALIAISYSIAALITGISNSFVLILSSLFYGIIFYFAINSTWIVDVVIKIFIAIIIGIIIKKMIWNTDLFYRIFINFNPEYGGPNAGSGFGVLLSYILNLITSIIIFLAVLLKKT